MMGADVAREPGLCLCGLGTSLLSPRWSPCPSGDELMLHDDDDKRRQGALDMLRACGEAARGTRQCRAGRIHARHPRAFVAWAWGKRLTRCRSSNEIQSHCPSHLRFRPVRKAAPSMEGGGASPVRLCEQESGEFWPCLNAVGGVGGHWAHGSPGTWMTAHLRRDRNWPIYRVRADTWLLYQRWTA